MEMNELLEKLSKKDNPIMFLYGLVQNNKINPSQFESAFYFLMALKIGKYFNE